ncbi:MAG TPA: hypothetical protein VMS30_05340 [Phycisphaerales bacterium]|nr:hypothetical protein [Phycisphaerales bacterium]
MARRILTSIIVLLIIGAVINVFVAWTCVALAKTRMFDAIALGRMRAEQYAAEDAKAARGEDPDAERYLALLFLARGTRMLIVDESNDARTRRISTQSAGWPWLGLDAEQIRDGPQPLKTCWGVGMGTMILDYPPLSVGSSTGPPAFPRLPIAGPPAPPAATTAAVTAAPTPRQTTDRLLPMRPVWPGFALNTAVYALAAWVMWLLWMMTMRTQRRLRGLCGRCAYPVGVSAVCTECGHRVRPRRA